MRQDWGRPFGLIVGMWVWIAWRGEALVSGEVGRMILRYAQNDKGRGAAARNCGVGRVILRQVALPPD